MLYAVKILPKNVMKMLKNKNEIIKFGKKFFVNIELMCGAKGKWAEIEKPVQKYWKFGRKYGKFCVKILEMWKKLLQNYCNQKFLQ